MRKITMIIVISSNSSIKQRHMDQLINYIVSGSKLAQKKYKSRYDWVGKVI